MNQASVEKTVYRGYSIEPWYQGVLYYKQSELDEHCGSTASSVQQAKREIDDKIFEATQPYRVETIIHLGGFRLLNITKFNWLSEAVQFASKFNGKLLTEFDAI